MGYSVGDKVEFIRKPYAAGLLRTGYLYVIVEEGNDPLWEIRYTRTAHEFHIRESKIIRKISS